ncbi:retrovirus-related pol polyprotein from transposon TNT 1-94 [Tanacetum coccineum]|uniref:Retrovirus-related pol polyprotein from transposon TNT 1-94 n=1 Tax=Tanacetum coccineum TaxID=301880 RepID=A0ABQ5HK28_9ASTR
MSTQQDIYAPGSENRPPMLNKENYVPWSSRLLHYAKSRPNGKLIYNSIMNGSYVRRMILELGDPARTVPVPEMFHEQTDDELTEAEIKQIEVDDQAIQTFLLGLPEDICASVDSCETAQEIWIRVQQMMKGSDIGIQEKKAKLFNEWERFTSTAGKSIESYYHRFLKLVNDFKRNKHFPEKIASNLKFLNNLQPEWSQHVTIVHQKKDLHTADYTQLYDFLKYNQKEVDELRAERLAKSQDPLALMANSNNSFKYPVFHLDLPSYNPTAAMNTSLALMAKAFKLNYSTLTNNNQRISSNPRNRQIAQPGNQVIQNAVQNLDVQNVGNQNGVIVVPGIAHQNGNGNVVATRAEGNANGNNGNQIRCYNCIGLGHLARNCTVRPRRRDDAYLQTQLLIAQKEEAGIQLQAEESDLMAVATDLDEIKEVNANCILMANLQQASTSGTQTDKAPVYESYGSAELLEPIPEPHEVPQNDSNVISEVSSVEQATEVEKVNSVNRKLRETNGNLTTELARYKIKKGKQIKTLNEEISNISKQLSKEKSTVSSLQEEKKRLKYDFKMRKDELLDKQIDLENKIKELDNILVKTADESLAKHKALELEIERLLRAVVSQDIMSIVQNNSVVDTLNLQTELDCTKERFENCIIKKENEYAKLWNDWIDPRQTSREKKLVPIHNVRASARTNPITISQPQVITKKVVNSDSNGFSSTRLDVTTKTRRPQPRSNTKNDRVLSVSKSSRIMNKDVKVEDHPRSLLLSKNKKHMSSECNNIKLAIWNDKSKIVCAMCKQCLIISNHDACVLNYVNGMNSRRKKQKAKVSNIANQMKHKPQLIASSESNGENACTPNPQESSIKRFPNSTFFLGRVYFIEGLGYNLFSVGQFCDSDLEVAFRRNTCFIRNLKGVKLLKGNCTTNLCTINLHDMASASPICLMARATSTKSWLWHQRLSHLNFDTINDLARNDLVTSLPKFKYHKEHLCPSCEQGKSKRASHLPKPVPISKQRLHLLYMDLCGPMRIASIDGKRYVLNDREDIEKLGAKRDIGFFIGYSANSCAYRNVDELEIQQQHGQPHPAPNADNVSHAMFDDNSFVNPFATPSTSAVESSSS